MPRLVICTDGGYGGPARWSEVSVNGAGPTGPGLLKLKQPDGSWKVHTDPSSPTGQPLRLRGSGWAPVLSMGLSTPMVETDLRSGVSDANIAMVVHDERYAENIIYKSVQANGLWGGAVEALRWRGDYGQLIPDGAIEVPTITYDFRWFREVVSYLTPYRTVTGARIEMKGFWQAVSSVYYRPSIAPYVIQPPDAVHVVDDPNFNPANYFVSLWDVTGHINVLADWETYAWRGKVDGEDRFTYIRAPYEVPQQNDDVFQTTTGVLYLTPNTQPGGGVAPLNPGGQEIKRLSCADRPPYADQLTNLPVLYSRNLSQPEFMSLDTISYALTCTRPQAPTGPWTTAGWQTLDRAYYINFAAVCYLYVYGA